MNAERGADLERIRAALTLAGSVLAAFTPDTMSVRLKSGDDPVTDADLAVDHALRATLPMPGDGWLSEETADAPKRLAASRVWIVDPIDGTREFVSGIPEWCVSVALAESGVPVAGGTLNPATGEMIIGAAGLGLTRNGIACAPEQRSDLVDAEVLASRSEIRRGEWRRFESAAFRVRPCGSVAYKLSLVAAGRASATWTLVPKSEWDIAAGVALLLAAGAEVRLPDGARPRFNQPVPRVTGLVASSSELYPAIERLLGLPERVD